MQVDVEDLENNKCLVKIRMNKSEVDREANAIALSLRNQAEVPGFRKGNAPVDRIRARYQAHVKSTAAEKLVYQGTAEALKDKKLRNISNPTLEEEFRVGDSKPHLGRYCLDGSFLFAVTVELPPKIDVKDYTSINVTLPHSNTSFKRSFETKMRQHQLMYGTKVPVKSTPKQGDEVIVDFEGFIDGQPMVGGKEENYRLIIGSGGMPAVFEDLFVDKPIKEEFSISVSFPDNVGELLSGKSCVFKCMIHEVNEIVPHELNDEFAVLNGHTSLDALKAKNKEEWDAEFAQPLRAQTFNSIMEKVLANNPFSAPKTWIDKELELTITRLNAQGLKDSAPAMESLRGLAERTVKIAFLLDQIYQKETSLHLSATDFMALAEEHGGKYGMSGTSFVEELKKSNQYEGFIVLQEQERVIDFLVKNAVVEELE